MNWMKVKKIVIAVFLLVILAIVILLPQPLYQEFFGVSAEELNPIWGRVLLFFAISSTALFWVGVPAGWRFAREADWALFGITVSVLVGMLLSLPIALFQLLRRTE